MKDKKGAIVDVRICRGKCGMLGKYFATRNNTSHERIASRRATAYIVLQSTK